MSEIQKKIDDALSESYGKALENRFKWEKKLRDEDMVRIKSYRRKIKKLLSSIDTSFSYRELSLAKTKLEEAEMWLSKLIKEGEK
jgi:hypothetical protein